jgi:hypothetical protein
MLCPNGESGALVFSRSVGSGLPGSEYKCPGATHSVGNAPKNAAGYVPAAIELHKKLFY